MVGYQRLRSIGSMLNAVESELEFKRVSGEEPISGKEISDLADHLLADMDNLMQRLKAHSFEPAMSDCVYLGGRLAERVDLLQRKTLSVNHRLNIHFTANVSTVVAAMAQAFRIRAREIAVVICDESPNMQVIISPEDLGEVLSLLAGNAVDALTGEGSALESHQKKITFRIREHGTKVRIEVENYGPAVQPEFRDSILIDGVTTKGNGHGHGLTYAQKHLTKYGAHLEYDKTFNDGARFYIDLIRV